MTTRSRRKRRLPRYVQTCKGGFRGWWMEAGVRRYTPTFRTAEEAHQEAKRLRDVPVAPGASWTLADGIAAVTKRLEDDGRRDGTRRYYRDRFAIICGHFDRDSPLKSFTSDHLSRFVAARRKRGVSPNTIALDLQVFGRIFEVSIEAGKLAHNPVKKLRRPQKVPARHDVFGWTEIQGLVSTVRAVSPIDGDVLALVLHTGLRRAEVARLRQCDVSPEGIQIDGKTGGRVLPAPPQLTQLLDALKQLGTGGPHYMPGLSEQQRTDFVRRVFDRWRKNLGEPRLRAHVLRHTFASRLAQLGVSEHVIGDLLGHARRRSSVTQRYISAFGREYVRAMELLWADPADPALADRARFG